METRIFLKGFLKLPPPLFCTLSRTFHIHRQYNLGGPVCGWPGNKSPTIWGLYGAADFEKLPYHNYGIAQKKWSSGPSGRVTDPQNLINFQHEPCQLQNPNRPGATQPYKGTTHLTPHLGFPYPAPSYGVA